MKIEESKDFGNYSQNNSAGKTASPSDDSVDLNIFYSQGYKKDSQNAEEAEVIAQDILSRYDISPDDINKNEKLLKIYKTMLSDEDNSALLDYCIANNVPVDYNEYNSQVFLDGVGSAMAHMSHDGSNVGDLITLGEVDFSQPDNTIQQKYTDVVTDNSGLTTISIYSDEDKTQLIASAEGLKFKTPENETKYKFSSGNQNTVDFVDTGSQINVDVTKGSLYGNYTVEKNNDNTYTFDGKQYSSLDEIAVVLNNVKLEASEEADSVINASRQGFGSEDCGILSGINSLSYTPYGKEVIKNALTYNDDGSITVALPGFGEGTTYTVTQEDLEKETRFSQGDVDVRAIELAIYKGLEDVVKGNIQLASQVPYYIRTPESLKKDGKYYLSNNFPQAVFYLLTGKDCSVSDVQSPSIRSEWFDEMEENGGIAISAGVMHGDGTKVPRLGSSSSVAGLTSTDAFGNEVKFVKAHAYAIKEANTKSNGERVITVVNPWDSSEEITLDEETFNNVFDTAYSINLRDNESYPIFYL